MPRRALSLVCVAFLAVTLGACGSSKKSSSSGSSAATNSAGDNAKAQNINLKTDDFPSDWTSSPSSKDVNSTSDKELFACSGLPDPATNTTATASSPNFAKGTFTQVSSEVRFAKTEAVAKQVLETFKTNRFPDCLKQSIDKQIKQEASGAGTVGELKIESLPAPSGADGAAFRISVPFSAMGLSTTLFIDVTQLRKGRALVTLSTSNGDAAFDSGLKGELTAKLISRIASNA